MGNSDKVGKIQVLERAAQILDLFTLDRPELRFSDMVAQSGLNKSTVFNIVDALRQLGFLEQGEDSRKYRLGRQFLRYGEIARRSAQIVKIAEPYMTQIRDAVNETVQLAKLQGGSTIYLHKVESLQPVQTFSMIGAANPAYATGLGKAMLAFRDAEYIDTCFPDTLPPLTKNTITDRQTLKTALAAIREEGVARDWEEYSLGLMCLACPVFDHNGNASYAISVTAPTYRMDENKAERICVQLKEKAEMISRQLGY